jgi:poly(A) polymerase
MLDPPPFDPEHPPEIPLARLDQDALRVVQRLRAVGHQAYFVGGCVRDLLLDATPKDFDVATDAHPGEVRAAFRNCRLIGRRFRLAHVYFRGGKVIEVATFRKNPTDVAEDTGAEGDLLITRDNVFGTAEEDAVRRDFTVNGLFYDPATGQVIDYVGGRADLDSHRMATIGDPEVRIREDPVRSLRAVRFAARLGFAIAPDTFEAMRRHASELARCAPARVLEEVFKLLRCGGSARAFSLLRACGALPVILPALGEAHDRWDEPQRRAFSAHLGALDRLVRSGAEISEAVLLGSLLMHLDTGEPGDGPAAALLEALVQSSRLPRKVAERIRLALTAQPQLREGNRPAAAGGRRRRRGRGLAGQAHFHDAVQLLQISVEATGQGREALERWRAEADKAPRHTAEGDAEAERSADLPRDEGRTEPRAEPLAAPRAAPRAEPAQPRRGAKAEVRSEGERHPVREARARPLGRRFDADGEALPAGGAGAVMEVGVGDLDEADEGDDEADEAAPAAAGSAPGPAGQPAQAGGNGRKRRRRGGRRRRRRGVGEAQDGAGTQPSGGGSPPSTGPVD